MAWQDVRGWLTDEEGALLARLAAGGRVLEVGTFAGRSTCCMLTTAAEVVAVDPHTFGSYEEAMANLTAAGGNWRIVREPIETAAGHLPKEYFDGLFLDATHTYHETLREYRAAAPLLKPEAWVAFHDWGPPPPLPTWINWPEVKQAAQVLFPQPPADTVGTIAVFYQSWPQCYT